MAADIIASATVFPKLSTYARASGNQKPMRLRGCLAFAGLQVRWGLVLGTKKNISEHGFFHGIDGGALLKSMANKLFFCSLMTEWE